MARRASQNVPEFNWTEVRARAAVFVAEDRLSDEQIADQVGVNRRQLTRWRAHPTFAARVAELVKQMDDAAARRGIARRMNRVRVLDDRWNRMQAVIAARAEEHAAIPGGSTGLLVRQVKQIGVGVGAREVTEYEVDTGLLRELREHEKQAAQELGQWSDKHELTGRDGGPIEVMEVLVRTRQEARALMGTNGDGA